MTNDLKNKVLRRLYQGNKFNDDLDLDTYHHAEAIEKIFESLKGSINGTGRLATKQLSAGNIKEAEDYIKRLFINKAKAKKKK